MTPLSRLAAWMCSRGGYAGEFSSPRGRCFRCRATATHVCHEHRERPDSLLYLRVASCEQHHKASCCTRFREPPETIRGAPMPLLEDAQIYVEQRLIWLDQRPPGHKKRRSEAWLGRWMQIIQREISRRKPAVIRAMIASPSPSRS